MKCSVIKKSLKSYFGKRLQDIVHQYKIYGLDWRSTIKCNERKRILTFNHVLVIDDIKAPLTDQELAYLQAVAVLISDINQVLEDNGLDVRVHEQLTKVSLNETTYA